MSKILINSDEPKLLLGFKAALEFVAQAKADHLPQVKVEHLSEHNCLLIEQEDGADNVTYELTEEGLEFSELGVEI